MSCSLFPPNLSKKGPPAQQDQSGGGCAIWQYINEFVISCACVALCRAGAFCLSDFWTLCPEVRGGSPGCRSPPAPVSVTRSPNTETEVYNDYHQSERFFIIGTRRISLSKSPRKWPRRSGSSVRYEAAIPAAAHPAQSAVFPGL